MKLEDHEFILLRDFIAQHFGIYFDDGRRWVLESKLSRLMERYTFDSFFEYYNFLMRKFYVSQSFNDPDLIELINSISNNETYFCRESGAFRALRENIFPEISRRQSFMRILSAGCSTGAEAYSIAAALLEADINFYRSCCPVLGVDIDPYVLKVAEAGVYGESAFRGINDPRRLEEFKNYFTPTTEGRNQQLFAVVDDLKNLVDFKQANILDKQALVSLGKFDIIFCRNVLIYFSDEGKREAIDNFSEVLNPEGYLFLGHSESIIGKSNDFNTVEKNNHIFYQKD
jgi:chemotaxis protein methyltransferase CheR